MFPSSISSPFLNGSNGIATTADSWRQYAAPSPARERKPAGTVIRVHVRVDDMGDPHVLGGRKGTRRVDILFPDVDGGALAERSAAEDVPGAAALKVIEGPKVHRASPDTSARAATVGKPAAFHSGSPPRSRRARLPLFRSNSTARSA